MRAVDGKQEIYLEWPNVKNKSCASLYRINLHTPLLYTNLEDSDN